MKALFYIPLLFILFLTGQNSFATSNTINNQKFITDHKITTDSSNHATFHDLIVLDVEEEIHNGNQVNDDTAKTFAVKLTSVLNLQAVTINSIVALKAAPVHYIAYTRIASNPIYITNRVLRL